MRIGTVVLNIDTGHLGTYLFPHRQGARELAVADWCWSGARLAPRYQQGFRADRVVEAYGPLPR